MDEVVEQRREPGATEVTPAQYRDIVEHAREAIYVLRGSRLLLVNREFEQLFGYDREELTSPSFGIDQLFAAESRAQLEERRRLRASGREVPVEYEFTALRRDGTRRIVSVRNCVLPGGLEPTILGTVRDVTRRREDERRLARQHVRMEALRDVFREALVCRTVSEVADSCLAAAQRVTESPLGMVGEVDAEGRFSPLAIGAQGWPVGATGGQGDDSFVGAAVGELWKDVLHLGECRLVNDVGAFCERAPSGDGPAVESFLGVPLRQGRRTIGMIALANRPDGYSEEDREEVVALAVGCVEALGRKRAELALEQSEATHRRFVAEAPFGIFRSSFDGVFLDGNPRFVQMLGCESRDELLALDLERDLYVDPGQRQAVLSTLVDVTQFRDLEVRWRRRDGREISVRLSGRVIRGERGPREIEGIAEDVTERRRMETILEDEVVRRRVLVEQSRDGIVVLDENGKVYEANRRYAEMLGYTPEEMSELHAWDWDDLYSREQILEMIRTVGPDGDHFETRHRRKGGSPIDMEISTNGALINGRKLVFCVCRDISRRKRAEKALVRSEARYRDLVESTSDWVWEVDAEGRYTWSSPGVESLLGYPAEEVIGRTPFDFMPPAEAERMRTAYGEIAAARRSFANLLNVNLHRNGREVVLETSGSPRFGVDGTFLGYGGVDRDVTDRRRAEVRLAAQNEVSRALAECESLDEAVSRVFAALAAADGWKVGALWEVEPERQVLHCVRVWEAEPEVGGAFAAAARGAIVAPGEGLPGEAYATRKPVAAYPLQTAGPWVRCRLAQTVGLHCGVAFPLVRDGATTGVVELLGPQARPLDPPLLDLLAGVGDQLGQFLARVQAQQEVQRFVASSPAVIYALRVVGDEFEVSWISENVEQMTGFPREEVNPGWWEDHIHPEDLERVWAAHPIPYEIPEQVIEFRFRRKNGEWIRIRDAKRLIRTGDGRPAEIVGSWSDVTERVRLEEQLRQSLKLEAVGQLAGGVAHDFNNLLTVIGGQAELALRRLPPEDPIREKLGDIRAASDRARDLTKQILAFSRRQMLVEKTIDPNEIVRDAERMLSRLLPENIELQSTLESRVRSVRGDPSQLEQVLINLAVNARDAMPFGGVLTIETRNVDLDREHASRHFDLEPGPYVVLCVSDTGQGMTREVRDRIFEPFFTTKEEGKGTGLGLASVYGTVKQFGGAIHVYSEPGEGSSFRIYLPAATAEEPPEAEGDPSATESPAAGGTILLVEDEPGVRDLAYEILTGAGYRVLVAGDGLQALELAGRTEEPIDLLLTDVIMPNLGGRRVAEGLANLHPEAKVIFMSGYTENAIVHHGVLEEGTTLLVKPFTPDELCRLVRDTVRAGA